jgi:hypothetical protein
VVFVRAPACLLLGLLFACSFDDSGESATAAATVADATGSSTGGAHQDVGTATTGPSTTRGADSTTTGSEGADSTTIAESEDEGSESTGSVPRDPSWCDDDHDALVACYDLQDIGQIGLGILPDHSGHENHAAIDGIEGDAGPLGHALRFLAGSNASVPDDASLNLEHGMTMEVLVRVDAMPPGGGRSGILDNDGQYSIFLYPESGLRCDIYGIAIFTPLPVDLGQWFHVACVRDEGTHRMFLDGVLAEEAPFDVTPNTDNPNPMAIGNDSPSWNDPLLGAIGGIRVWSRPLDAQELCLAAPSCRR